MVLTYNPAMFHFPVRWLLIGWTCIGFLLISCYSPDAAVTDVDVPDLREINASLPNDFAIVDGSRPLVFPRDFGAHEDFRTEWWYYTGNLETSQGRHFGFQFTIFRVGLLPPTVSLPTDSQWYDHSAYFAHVAISDISSGGFYAFDRYSRPGPGLAGAKNDPYHVWIEDWQVSEQAPHVYHLRAAEGEIALDLTLTDEMGIVLHGENGYSRKGQDATNASYYYSQPRLQAEGFIQVNGSEYKVNGLAWHDHEFSSSVLDADQIGWDWFSLQFEDGRALMLFRLRERTGKTSTSSSGTFMAEDGTSQTVRNEDFKITVLEEWHSPHRQAVYPAAWRIELSDLDCVLEVRPWTADQEINFATITYWEGAVHFEGACNGIPVNGSGYVELTGYAGAVPLP